MFKRGNADQMEASVGNNPWPHEEGNPAGCHSASASFRIPRAKANSAIKKGTPGDVNGELAEVNSAEVISKPLLIALKELALLSAPRGSADAICRGGQT